MIKQDTHVSIFAAILGIHNPKGSPKSMVDQWNSLALICALLTGVAAAGLFISGEMVLSFKEKDLSGVNATSISIFTIDDRQKRLFSKMTMTLFCIDTFCFLNSTVIATFFVAFVSRHQELDLDAIHAALGMAFHWPQIYFRVGFIVMVASFCFFFVLVMDPLEMGSCLAFCITFIMAPMGYALGKAMSLFAIEANSSASTKANSKVAPHAGS